MEVEIGAGEPHEVQEIGNEAIFDGFGYPIEVFNQNLGKFLVVLYALSALKFFLFDTRRHDLSEPFQYFLRVDHAHLASEDV